MRVLTTPREVARRSTGLWSVGRPRPTIALLLLAACVSLPTVAPRRVVLVSFDGLSADEMERRDLPAFARLAREGLLAKRVIPVTPTQTSSTHVAILTGQEPNVTGIVSNRFRAGEGFTTDIDAETIVEVARKDGKRVGSIAFPTIDARNERRSADFGLVWTAPLTRPRTIQLTAADFHAEGNAVRHRLEWVVPERTRIAVDVVAYDTTDDQIVNYDTIVLERGATKIPRDDNGWFAISEQIDGSLYGSWSKLMHATPTLDDVTIYWGSVSTTIAYPDPYREMIDREVGFWPGPPEARDPETFAEQTERFGQFFSDATAVTIRQMPFDLLLVYQPILDETEHQFGIETLWARAYGAADRAVATMTSLLDPSHDALIVTGDHGLAPVDTEVRVNRLIADFPEWEVYASGNVAHLYGSTRTEDVIARLRESGFFERITRRGPSSHPNSGDVVAYSYPHVALTTGDGEPVRKPSYYGQHGGLASHHEFHTRLYAWGAGIAPRSVGGMRQTDIAPLLARLLGVRTPRALAGTSTAPRGPLPPRSPAPARWPAAARPSSPSTAG